MSAILARTGSIQSPNSGTNGGGDFAGFFWGYEFFNQHQAEIDRSAGAARGDDFAVNNHTFVLKDVREFFGDGEMGGVAAALEQAGVVEHGGRSADGGEPATGGGLLLYELAHAHVASEIEHARAAGEENEVVGLFGSCLVECRVCVHGHGAPAGDVRAVAKRGDGDLATGAAEQIDRSDGFDFFKSLWQNGENRGHGFKLTKMADLAPGIFCGKHLVVFGAGYVGGAVAREAVRLGARVTALTRNPTKVAALAGDGCDVVVDELASDGWHGKIGRGNGGVDFVLNCVSSGGGGIEGYRQSYVEGMKSILRWADASGGVDTFVYTSSTSVYSQSGGVRVDETMSVGGDVIGTPAVLLEAEELLRGAALAARRRWFILRLAGIYGPGRHRLLDQLRAGETEIDGCGKQRLNLIHRDDIVAAVLAAFAASKTIANEVFNVADNGAARKDEVVNWLAHQLGRGGPSFTGAAVVGRRAGSPDRVIGNDKIKAVLGWLPCFPDYRAGYRAILEA